MSFFAPSFLSEAFMIPSHNRHLEPRESLDKHRGSDGFTLIELLVVILVLAIIALVGMPALQTMILRSKLEGFARTFSVNLQVARQEAIKRSVPVVVEFDLDNNSIRAFADVQSEDPNTEELIWNDPPTGAVHRTADYEIWNQTLPVKREGTQIHVSSVLFAVPDGLSGDKVAGFTEVNDPTLGATRKIVYEPDGSIRDVGAIRFGDFRGGFANFPTKCGNCFQLAISPAATGKTHLMKWNHDTDLFLPRGQTNSGVSGEGNQWLWY
jgi:prepilin-type N-terminal cleavage/methylation domain-containing protein